MTNLAEISNATPVLDRFSKLFEVPVPATAVLPSAIKFRTGVFVARHSTKRQHVHYKGTGNASGYGLVLSRKVG